MPYIPNVMQKNGKRKWLSSAMKIVELPAAIDSEHFFGLIIPTATVPQTHVAAEK